MFSSTIILCVTFLSVIRADCSLEENIYGNDISYSYTCSEIIVTLSYTNGTNNGRLSLDPSNYEECAVLSVDRLSKLEIKGAATLDFLELSISNIELDQTKKYSEVMSKLGISPKTIRTVSMYSCINVTLSQLEGFDEIWNLELSSSLNTESLSNGPVLGKIFPKLRMLRLDSNQLKLGPSLVGLELLEEILFSYNSLEELPENYFADNAMLTMIDISESDLKKFPSNICQGLDSLESLSLYILQASFPKLGNCSELRQIYIQRSFDAENEFSDVSATQLFPEMSKVSSVMLSNLALTKVTKETFGRNVLLTSLSLSFNNIEEISDDAFFGLKKLNDLDVSYNNISKLSDGLLPSSIDRFSASGNLIKQFKITKSLPKLTHLDLSDSQLSDTFTFNNIPKTYPSLQYLNLQGNHLINFSISGSLDFIHGNDVEINLSSNYIQILTVSDLISSDQGSSRIKIDLSNNPLLCDCGLKSFVQVLRQKNSRIKVIKDVSCNLPKGETLKTIDLGKMKC